MASDSRFINAVGFDSFLDIDGFDPLPAEDVALAAAAAAASVAVASEFVLPLVFDANGEGGFEDMTLAEREKKELEWNDPGDDLFVVKDEDELGAHEQQLLQQQNVSGGGIGSRGFLPPLSSKAGATAVAASVVAAAAAAAAGRPFSLSGAGNEHEEEE